MKKLFLTLVLGIVGLTSFSQAPGANSNKNAVYLGTATGINNTNGMLGLRLDAMAGDKLMLGAGLGIGSWGTKITFSGYLQTPSNWCPMIGFGHTTGADSLSVDLEVKGKTGTQHVGVELRPINYINLGVQKQWFVGSRRNRLFVEFGYSVPLQTGSTFRVLSPTVNPITEQSKQVMKFISPGGLIVAFGFAFKL